MILFGGQMLRKGPWLRGMSLIEHRGPYVRDYPSTRLLSVDIKILIEDQMSEVYIVPMRS